MGLGGMALALLGCDVMLTDVAEVLPLLRRNAAQVRPEALRAADGAVRGADVGRAEVRELDWGVEAHVARALREAAGWEGGRGGGAKKSAGGVRSRRPRRSSGGSGAESQRRASLDRPSGNDADADAAGGPPAPPPPPFDAIVAADCVYAEGAVPVLLRAVLALSGRQTAILVANERRSSTICDAFERAFGEHFAMKRVPYAKLDPEHRHPLIELWQLRRKRAPAAAAAAAAAAAGGGGAEDGAQAELAGAIEGLALREEDEGQGEDEEDARDQEGDGGGKGSLTTT
jgi:hypothetical protein